MKCVNLKEQFGQQYKVGYEEGPDARPKDPWLMIVRCYNGHICPWGGSTLAACTNNSGAIASRLKRLPFAIVVQDGDDGANVLFDVEHFDEVAKIMRPRRRKYLSEEQRQKAAERLAEYHFKPARQASKTALPGVSSGGVL